MKKLLTLFLVLLLFSCTKDLYEIPTAIYHGFPCPAAGAPLEFTVKGNVSLGTTHPHELLYVYRTSDTSKFVGIGGKNPSEKLHIITKP
jgi:hypothetical protein